MQVSDEMVRAAADILLSRVNAPEQEIYRAARDALSAAARVRAEANAEGGEPEGELCKCAPAFHEHDEAGAKHCRSCDAEWHPAPQPSGTVEVKGRKALVEKYASAVKRLGREIVGMPECVIRQHFDEFLDEALSALTAGKPEQSGWKPIETAPKDGTKFLGYGSYLYPGDDHVTEYIEVIEYSGDPEWPWEGQGGKGRPEVFSHWQPLPAAPTAGGGE